MPASPTRAMTPEKARQKLPEVLVKIGSLVMLATVQH